VDNDFGLWKVKMEAVLIQQKFEKALKGEGALTVTHLFWLLDYYLLHTSSILLV